MTSSFHDATGRNRNVQDVLNEMESQRLRTGGGGPYDTGMDQRVAKLEALMEVVRGDVSELRGDMKSVRDRLTRLEVKVDHLPTKSYFIGGLLLLLSAIAALVAFADKIQSLVS